jgi:hypothetical protein
MKRKKSLQLMILIGFVLRFSTGCQQPSPSTEDVIRKYTAGAELHENAHPDSGYVAGKAVAINIRETIDLSRLSLREQKDFHPG